MAVNKSAANVSVVLCLSALEVAVSSRLSSSADTLGSRRVSGGACNPSYWEAEAGGSLELRASGLQWTMSIGVSALSSVSIWCSWGSSGPPGRLRRGEPAQVGDGAGQSPRVDQ